MGERRSGATVEVATKVIVSGVPTNVEPKHPKYALGLWSPYSYRLPHGKLSQAVDGSDTLLTLKS